MVMVLPFVQEYGVQKERRLSDHSSRKKVPTGRAKLKHRELTSAQDAAYEASIQQAIDAALQHARNIQRDEAQAARVLAVLERGGLEALDKIPRKVSHLARMKALLARSWQLRHENPRLMVEFAVLAVQVCRLLDS